VAQTRQNRIWAIVILVLVAVIIITSFVAWSRYHPGQPVEIVLPSEKSISGSVIIDGAVTNPGIYPFKDDDTIRSLIQSAGGITVDGDTTMLELYIQAPGTGETTQKININNAEAWLLEALPGIGPTRAQAIVVYREQNGPFKNIIEIMKVEGISQSIYEQIKNMITVSD
jgi:competence protein ComEA